MRILPYVLVDVFSARPLAGNQLAVFLDGSSLGSDEMQALARETNLAETTFVIPPRGEAPRVRIFTAEEEVPFAGHPTLGTAFVLREGRDEVTLTLGVGRIPVRFETRPDGVYGEMRQRDPVFGRIHDPDEVARATGVPRADFAELPIQTVSTGLPFCVVPMRSLAALQAISLSWPTARAYLRGTDAQFFYFITTDTGDVATRVRARQIFGSGEDPATGSAAGCTASYLVHHGVVASEQAFRIEQGVEMKRPSVLHVRASRSGAQVTDVRVGGYVVAVAEGAYRLP